MATGFKCLNICVAIKASSSLYPRQDFEANESAPMPPILRNSIGITKYWFAIYLFFQQKCIFQNYFAKDAKAQIFSNFFKILSKFLENLSKKLSKLGNEGASARTRAYYVRLVTCPAMESPVGVGRGFQRRSRSWKEKKHSLVEKHPKVAEF